MRKSVRYLWAANKQNLDENREYDEKKVCANKRTKNVIKWETEQNSTEKMKKESAVAPAAVSIICYRIANQTVQACAHTKTE